MEPSADARDLRWRRLATVVPMEKLDELTSEIPLSAAMEQAHNILAGRVRGRTVVNVNK